jgi:hypothetical protein
MKEDNFGRLFLRQLVMAVPWGIIFLIVLFIAAAGIKQQVKEGVQYAIVESINEAAVLAFDYRTVTAVKKNVKEVKGFLNDPQVKQDIKEALEYSGEKFRK